MKSVVNKKKKGKYVLLAVLLILALLIGSCVYNTNRTVQNVKNSLSARQTATASIKTLTKSVGAVGKLKSINKKDISVDLPGVKLSELNVAVGDVVAKDQLLAVFDTSDIEKNLADAEESLSIQQSQSDITKENMNRNVNDAQRMADYSVDSAKTNMDSAKESLDDVTASIQTYRDQFHSFEEARDEESKKAEELEKEIETLKKNIKTAEKNLEKATENFAAASSSYIALLSGKTEAEIEEGEARGWSDPGEEEILAAFEAYTAATAAKDKAAAALKKNSTEFEKASSNLVKAKTNYETYAAKLEALNVTIEKLEESEKQLKNTYNAAVKAYDNTVASQQSSVASAKNTAKASELSSSSAFKSYEKQIETYTEQLRNGSLYSPIDGVVTAINYQVGDRYQAGAVLTIQDTEHFYIESEINEYDIPDIAIGQKVLIKTEATGDEEMEGTVTFVSPVASQASALAGAQGSSTYTVKISLDNPSDRLRLDMRASLSIIITQHDNALVVPYNTVSLDENGKAFVKRQIGENEYETIYVTVVMESNYYTEILSDEIKDGDILQIIVKTESNSIWDDLTEGGFVF